MTELIDGAAATAPISPQEDVELTIRQAYQAQNDFVFTCPTSWTIKQVKEHIKNCVDKHPAISTQRLIFSGASLKDDMILSNILKERSHVAGEQIFFHLVIAQPYQATQEPSEVRRRNVNAEGNNRQDPSTTSSPVITSEAYAQNMAAWQQYWAAYNQLPAQSQQMEHQRLMAHYYTYAMTSAPTVPVEQVNANNLQLNAAIWRARVQGQAPAAANQANHNGNNNQGRVDLLEVGYRIFKLVLLFSAILLYSSFERFAVVLLAALFIYFIQLRRNQARQRAQAQAAAPNAAAQPAEPHVNNNNNGENDGENVTPQAAGETPAAPEVVADAVARQSGMQVFLATCYSFVTSFFASLVPDHPMPMDLN